MHYKFLQAVHIQGRDYPRGVHSVSEKVEYDAYFLKLVSSGLVVEVEASKVVSPESSAERSKKLLDKLLAKKPVKAEAPATSEKGLANVHQQMRDALVPPKDEPKAPEAPPVESKKDAEEVSEPVKENDFMDPPKAEKHHHEKPHHDKKKKG